MIGKRNVSLRELRTFCIAAEMSSFRDTAEAMFLTPSAVSHQVKSLEEVLDLQLFERLTRSIELTEAGHALYADVCPLISELDAALERHASDAGRTVLRISVQPFFASELVVPSLGDFTALNPDIDIKLETSDESLEKHAASADVSIRLFRKAPTALISHRLFSLRLVLAASPDLKKRMRKLGDKAFDDLPRIVHESRPGAWRQWEQQSGRTIEGNGRVVRCDSMLLVANAAERGVGTALVPLQLSDSRFEAGSLAQIYPDTLESSDAYYLVYRKEDRAKPAIKAFRDWALERFFDAP
jgi:LysR family glycine cleavage system transcriptional activator